MKEKIKYIYGRLRLRPLASICMLFVLSTMIYVNSSLYKKGMDVYQPGCNNYFERNKIYEGQQVRLIARIKSLNLRDINGRPTYVVLLNHVETTDEISLCGTFSQIQVYFPANEQLKIGQRIEFNGSLSYFDRASNHGEFDSYKYYYYNDVLFRVYDGQVIKWSRDYDRLGQYLYKLRLFGEEKLLICLGEEDSAIMKAMIFGNKNEISEDVKDLFRKNGIAHILAISGLHISIIAMGLYKLLIKGGLGFKVSAALSFVVIFLYGIMVGFPVSAFRAIMMFGIYLLSKVWLRTYDIMTSMAVVLTLTLFLHPGRIMDTGLQLSYMAVLGVGFFCSKFARNIYKYPMWASPGFVSLFVFLSTMPVILRAYYDIAFYSILLNLVIIPLMSILLLAGIGLLLVSCGMKAGIILNLLTFIVKGILYLYKGTCAFLTEKGMGRMNVGSPSLWQTGIFWTLLIIAVGIEFRSGKGVWKRLAHFAGCVGLGLVIIMVRPHSGLSVWMLDVGQGDGMVIQNEYGHVYLIDGGSSSRKNIGERVIMPMLKYYGVNEIEGVFVTHPDSDHMNGLLELMASQEKEKLRVKRLFMYEGFLEDEDMEEIITLAKAAGSQVIGLHRGQGVEDGKLNISVLYPYSGMVVTDKNNASLVMRVNYGKFDMLTTGDVEAEGERTLLDLVGDHGDGSFGTGQSHGDGSFVILKVAHHGSSSSSTEEFLDWVNPRYALISAGRNNSYGHPHAEVLERLSDIGTCIYRTDEKGEILLKIGSNGGGRPWGRFFWFDGRP